MPVGEGFMWFLLNGLRYGLGLGAINMNFFNQQANTVDLYFLGHLRLSP